MNNLCKKTIVYLFLVGISLFQNVSTVFAATDYIGFDHEIE